MWWAEGGCRVAAGGSRIPSTQPHIPHTLHATPYPAYPPRHPIYRIYPARRHLLRSSLQPLRLAAHVHTATLFSRIGSTDPPAPTDPRVSTNPPTWIQGLHVMKRLQAAPHRSQHARDGRTARRVLPAVSALLAVYCPPCRQCSPCTVRRVGSTSPYRHERRVRGGCSSRGMGGPKQRADHSPEAVLVPSTRRLYDGYGAEWLRSLNTGATLCVCMCVCVCVRACARAWARVSVSVSVFVSV